MHKLSLLASPTWAQVILCVPHAHMHGILNDIPQPGPSVILLSCSLDHKLFSPTQVKSEFFLLLHQEMKNGVQLERPSLGT